MHRNGLVEDSSSLSFQFRDGEPYAIETGVSESIARDTFLAKPGFISVFDVLLHTDSSSAKSIALGFRVTRWTRHITSLSVPADLDSGSNNGLSKFQDLYVSDIMVDYVSSETLLKHMLSLGLAHLFDA